MMKVSRVEEIQKKTQTRFSNLGLGAAIFFLNMHTHFTRVDLEQGRVYRGGRGGGDRTTLFHCADMRPSHSVSTQSHVKQEELELKNAFCFDTMFRLVTRAECVSIYES